MRTPQCFKKINKLWQRIIVGTTLVLSLSLCFPAGLFNNSSQIGICSEYFTTLTKKHTKNKEYSAMIVETKDGSKEKLISTEKEFHELYGSFRSDKVCFASTINAEKKFNITLDEAGVDKLSLLFTDTGINVKEVDGYGWRHEFYPLTMMYAAPKSERPGSPYQYCFISKSHADALLKAGFTGEVKTEPFTDADYKALQYKTIHLSCNGDVQPYYILSIYFDLDDGNYFTDALNDIMGDFVFIYGKNPGNLKKQATYFMRGYDFQNEQYIKHAKEYYNISDFDYKVNDYNVIDDFATREDISSLIFPNDNNAISIFLCVLSIFLLLSILTFIVLTNFGNHWIDISIAGIACFVPYIVFKIIYLVSDSSKLFSSFATQFNMFALIAFILLFAIILLFKNSRRKKENVK